MARQKLIDNESFTKALMLGVALIAGIILIDRIPALIALSETVFADTPGTLSSEGQILGQEEWEAQQKKMAGLWFYESPSTSDRIELKDNGIIWRYTTRRFKLPFGKLDSLSHVSTAYLQPFSLIDSTDKMNLNIRVIQETWLAENIDTCYGKSMYDNLWVTDTLPVTNMLNLNGLTYYKYTGSPYHFFPENVLNYVGKFELDGCNVPNYKLTWIRESIGRSFAGEEMDFQMLTTIHYDMVKNYYAPMCLAAVVTGVEENKPFDIDMHIYLNKNGIVDSSKVISKTLKSKFSILNLTNEIAEWTFPADGETPLEIKFKGTILRKSLNY